MCTCLYLELVGLRIWYWRNWVAKSDVAGRCSDLNFYALLFTLWLFIERLLQVRRDLFRFLLWLVLLINQLIFNFDHVFVWWTQIALIIKKRFLIFASWRDTHRSTFCQLFIRGIDAVSVRSLYPWSRHAISWCRLVTATFVVDRENIFAWTLFFYFMAIIAL